MKILAIDSSGSVASVAVMTEDTMIAEYTVNHKKTHSQTLLPMIESVMKMVEEDINELDAIAVAKGPGSFTGLRIGAATVKGLALAADLPVIPVPTVDALAYNFFATDCIICPMMDARREQVYCGLYEFAADGTFKVLVEQKACALEEIIAEVNSLGKKVVYLGDGADRYAEQIKSTTVVEHFFAHPHMSKQRAGAVGNLGIAYFKGKIYENADNFAPEYLRLSQAEREELEKTQKSKTLKG